MSALSRRLVTVPRMVALFIVLFATAPALFPAALAIDVARYAWRRVPFTTTRLLAFGLVYTWSEVVGMLVLAAAPAFARGGREGLLEQTYRIQAAWAQTLFWAARRLFALSFEVEGIELLTPGPVVLFMRHASLVDTLLPTVLLAQPSGLRLRVVMKRELLGLPCLDIAGNRLPNRFVARGGEGSAAEIARVAELARDMGPRDGVLIYPEGTRFSEAKRARALATIAVGAPLRHARVRALTRLLPVRPGGPLALLDAGTDVVLVAHVGLESCAKLSDVWSGEMVGRRVVMSLRRCPRAEIPADPSLRLAWLDARWLEMDRWIAERGDEARRSPSRAIEMAGPASAMAPARPAGHRGP